MSITIVATIFVFGLLVFIHEFGHFITAKMVGMRVDEFAIGFGPKLISRRHGETLYSIRIVPLGGFNKISGMDPDEEQDERSFNAKSIWARLLVIIAGSAMNLLLPIVLFTIVFLSAGIDRPSEQPIVGTVLPDKPAYEAGLMAGDVIRSVNNQTIASWQQFVSIVMTNSGNSIDVEYERNGVNAHTKLTPQFDASANRGIIGVMPVIHHEQPGIFESIGLSFKQTILVIASMLAGIVQMVTGRAPADLAGPIGVAQMAGQVAQMGFIPLLQFAAFLSLNLGLINLFPVPMLDGGHVVTLLVEGVRGKPLPSNQLQFIQMIGLVLLLMLFLFTTFKDISRLNL